MSSNNENEPINPTLNKADVIRSKFVFVRYLNWDGKEKIQVVEAENEGEARLWMKTAGFEIKEAKQIYFL